ncbi:MAG: methionine aminotransferase [Flavobacteriales bacterium]|nr:methionine aminotransferase [Flavobacteriales bacterium]
MSKLAQECGAINLSQGFPDFEIDPRLKEFVKEGLDKNQVQYAPMPGRLDLRMAIAKKIELQHGISVDPETEITVTAGATQAIYCAISAVIEEGDEVILFDPAYDCYDPTIRLNKGIPVHLKLKHPTYKIDWDELREKLTAKSRMLIVNNPHNPCGSVWDESDLAQLEQLLRDFPKLLVLSDEVYEHIQFEGTHQSVLKNDYIRSRSFVCYSFGKTFHATGWKVGYCVAPKTFSEELRVVHQFNVFCVNNTIQYALATYMNQTNAWQEVTPFYKEKRDLFLDAMQASRFKPLNCQGTYFCLFDYSAISNENDVEFAKRITHEHGVATIPVSVFYGDKTDHKVVRFCFAKENDTLLKATDKLCRI